MAVELQISHPQIEPEPSPKFFHSEENYRRLGTGIIAAYCVACPISIALSQITIGLLVLLSLYCWWASAGTYFSPAFSSRKLTFLLAPILSWLAISGASSFFGLDFGSSFSEFVSSSLFLLFPLFVYVVLTLYNQKERISTIAKLLVVLGISQMVASLHSLFEAGFATELALKIPGALTESGQLVLVIPCLLGLVFANKLTSGKTPSIFSLAPATLFACLVLFAWPESISNSHANQVQLAAGILSLALFVYIYKNSKYSSPAQILAFLGAALIVNLKRGPWIGVFVAVLVLGSFLSKRLLACAGIITLAAFMLLSPVRERTLSVIDHYLIGGGRHEMWTIGLEITQRFPLGVGLDNADVIQKFDPDLPDTHRHMHNNFLNVAVELGWLGLIIYLWWMFRFIAVGIKNALTSEKLSENDIYLLAFSTAILGWQVAGFAEYNFGDSEIKLLAFLIMGFIMALYCNDKLIKGDRS